MKCAYLLLLLSCTHMHGMDNETTPEKFLNNSVDKMIYCAEQAHIPTNKGLAGIFKKMQQNDPASLFKEENKKYIQRAEELYDALQINDTTKWVITELENKKAAFEKTKEEYTATKDMYEKHMLLCIANYLKCNCPQFKFPQTNNLAAKLASQGQAAIEDNKEILTLNQDFENTPEHEEWITITCLLRTKIFSTLQSSD